MLQKFKKNSLAYINGVKCVSDNCLDIGSLHISGPKIIKLRLETRLKSQASDWLKWRHGGDMTPCIQISSNVQTV
jgi:hypothetical protein